MRTPFIAAVSIMASLGYVNTIVARAQPLQQPQPTTVLATHGPSMDLVEELTGWSTQLSGIIRASPRCWTIAINALSELMYLPTQTSTEFCATMTQLQQDILAIELARCHTEKSGKPFIVDGENISADDCAGHSLIDQAQVDACLAHLDPTSYDRYVDFTMHVQSLCVRFTDELVTARKEQAALLLAQSSSAVTKQLQDLMEKNDHLINKVIEQQELLGNQSIKMKEFSDKFDVMQDGVSKMQDGVTHTTNNFHSIEAIIGRVTRGYSWFTSFIHFLVALNVVWLLTMNKRSRKIRSVLVNMVMLETLFEILSHWAVYNNYLRPEDQVRAVSLWRRTFMMVELFAYFVVLVFSPCFSGDNAEVKEEAEIISAMKEQMKREQAEARKQMAELWTNHQVQGIGTRGAPSTTTRALMADPFETMRGRQQQNHQQNSQLQLQHHRQYHRARSYSPVRPRDSFHPRNHCRLLPVADIAPTIGSVMIEANVMSPPPKSTTNLLSAAVYDHAADSTRSSDSSTSTRSGDDGSDKEGETVPDCGRKRKRTAGENTKDMNNPPRPDDDTDSSTAVKSEPDEIVTTRSSAKKKKKRRG